MEEDLISDEIYGDLGDFEFNEKLKEQSQKIEDLTDQLNQSMLTINGLQTQMKNLSKVQKEIKKNYSSLLLTARAEINRKNENINQLRQSIDNRVFRRRNTHTPAAVESNRHAIVDPVFSNANVNNNLENMSDLPQLQPVNDLSKFRIPKKNPFARHENDADRQNHITACNGMENGHEEPGRQLSKKHPNPQARRHDVENEQHNNQNHADKARFDDRKSDIINGCKGTESARDHDQSKRHLPKKNPQARCHDADNDLPKKQTKQEKERLKDGQGNHGMINEHDDLRLHLPKKNPQARRHDIENEIQKPSHEVRENFNGRRDEHKKQTHDDRGRLKNRRDEFRDNRKHSPDRHTSRGHRDTRKSHSNSNDRKRGSSRNSRKRSRGQSSSDDMDRQKKRRPDSSPNRHRSRSRPARIDEKVKKAKSPRKDHSKHSRSNRSDEVKSKNISVSSLLEKDLEAMLETQKKILDEIECTDNEQRLVQNEKLSPEHRKRKSSHTGDPAKRTSYEDGDKDLDSANDDKNTELNRATTANVEVLAESENTVEVLPVNIGIIQRSSDTVVASPETTKVSVESENPIQELLLDEATTPTDSQKICSPSKEVKPPLESIDEIIGDGEVVPNDVSESIDGKSEEVNVSEEIPQSTPSETTKKTDDREDVPMSRSPTKFMNTISEEENSPKRISESTTLESITKDKDGENVSNEVSKSTPSKLKNRKSDAKKSPKKVVKSSPAKSKSKNDDEEILPQGLLTSTPSKVEGKVDVPNILSESAHLPNDENSNMDIDYELMEHTPHVENQTNLPCKETDLKILVETPPETTSPTVTKGETINETTDESFNSMKVAVHNDNCLSESTLNNSQERHILSKSKEYTVEDAGYEIRIFLTKKRRKNKTSKTTS